MFGFLNLPKSISRKNLSSRKIPKFSHCVIRIVKEVIFYDVFVGSHVNCIKMAKRSSVCVPQSDAAGDCQKGLIKASLVV